MSSFFKYTKVDKLVNRQIYVHYACPVTRPISGGKKGAIVQQTRSPRYINTDKMYFNSVVDSYINFTLGG